ncbi:MAG: adenosylcobinamide-GDP ribazoletransferase [archaeon]|nr:adenosylcobinamide-GDP ribazoletransferase [archaeon]MCP8316842.1 adenosylcobinamide-GDP ribazoletransferase [archaeon]MCP8319322.1 adenosylcobinamide-GDP ribazoletransferase [archaeon]
MKILRGLKSIIAFLTIIPVGKDNSLEDMGNYMPLFPLVGLLIGSISGIFAWSLLHLIPSLIVGVLTLGFILLITGLHHTDGLLDFGDGIMYQGSPERKIEVMHDKQTGAGGLSFGLIILMTTAFSISFLTIYEVIQSLILAEISAKLAMVMIAWAGRSAHKGLGSYCVDAMHSSHRILRLIIPLAICFSIAIILMLITGFIVIISAMIVSLIIVWVSNRHFKGVTGDVFGAANEIARMTSLIIILVI